MAFGPGKYDDEVTELRERLQADGIILLVINGCRGEGFSAQLPGLATVEGAYEMLMRQASTLRSIADQCQADARRLRQQSRGN